MFVTSSCEKLGAKIKCLVDFSLFGCFSSMVFCPITTPPYSSAMNIYSYASSVFSNCLAALWLSSFRITLMALSPLCMVIRSVCYSAEG